MTDEGHMDYESLCQTCIEVDKLCLQINEAKKQAEIVIVDINFPSGNTYPFGINLSWSVDQLIRKVQDKLNGESSLFALKLS